MQLIYTFLAKDDTVLMRYCGNLSFARLLDIHEQYVADPLYATCNTQVIDLSELTTIDADFRQVMSFVHRVIGKYERDDRVVRGIMYAPDDVQFGMARMYGSLAGATQRLQIEIFRERQEVARALGSTIDDIWNTSAPAVTVTSRA